MSLRRALGLWLVLMAALFSGGALVMPQAASGAEAQAASQQATPDAATLLFENPQLANTKAGQTLTYKYSRKVADPELGASFDDRVVLMIEASANGGDARDVRVDFFTPERHHAAGPFEGVTTNPMLLLFLENHLGDLSGRLKGNPRYFKTAIRTALRDAATVTAADLSVGGQTVKGWRVTVTPFKGDPNAVRMRGLDTLAYTFEVSPEVPGQIVRLAIKADAPGGTLWEESIAYDPTSH
ncbi:hypothetical protein LJE71_06745 [Xanthobacter autotrophicus]|uniref:hypothetical protein n=1 Tax=Xanthobacter autotrophicus TaxID=280 RepID=UPI001E378361|nr:hypothetical protein [Xanthobacter autotrophicus]UDQ90695.1 hypothetical protein LJE71_06745 [Xanthobacter autotrophicus]